jgi:tRNA(fMet)-specific endonuclease VapC
MILLDTTFLIDYFRGWEILENLIENDTGITTTLNYHEIMTGVKRSKSKREELFFKTFFTKIELLDLPPLLQKNRAHFQQNYQLLVCQ